MVPDDSGLPPAMPCGPWAGVGAPGTTWDYVPSEGYVAATGFDGAVRIEVLALAGALVTLVESGDLAGEAGRSTWVRTESWDCGEGEARWTASAVEGTIEAGGELTETRGQRSFDPGWKVRPATLSAGDTWVDRFTQRAEVNGGEPSETAVSCTSTAGDPAILELPAGAFVVLPLTVGCDTIGADSPWLAEGVGMVASEDLVLVAHAPG